MGRSDETDRAINRALVGAGIVVAVAYAVLLISAFAGYNIFAVLEPKEDIIVLPSLVG